MTTNQLIVFTRYPTVGQAKTRLIPALGAAGAAELHRQMTVHTLAQVRELQQYQSLAVTIYFAGQQHQSEMVAWLGSEWQYQQQVTGDLGVRMATAFADTLQSRMQKVVIIGTDCPGLTAEIIQNAFEHLSDHDLVLGPAIDGGYYLIGLRSIQPELFIDIPWSTDEVLAKTINIAQQLPLSIALLPPLADVDRPVDLPVWELHSGRYESQQP
jgi:rSAM/selenodomain-associated transferase 1